MIENLGRNLEENRVGVIQGLFDGGKTWCGILADLANPASNRIYQRLGFQEACRYREYTFEGDLVTSDLP